MQNVELLKEEIGEEEEEDGQVSEVSDPDISDHEEYIEEIDCDLGPKDENNDIVLDSSNECDNEKSKYMNKEDGNQDNEEASCKELKSESEEDDYAVLLQM